MQRSLVWLIGIILALVAATFAYVSYANWQKRQQQSRVTELVRDSTDKLRQALDAKPTPDLVQALDANLQATKAPRDPALADAAEHYILGAREIAKRRLAAIDLERRAAASRAALAGHMARASRRNDAWLRDALVLKKRVEADHYDLGLLLKALDELLYGLPESEKRLEPHVGAAALVDPKLAATARAQIQDEAKRADEELMRVRRLVP